MGVSGAQPRRGGARALVAALLAAGALASWACTAPGGAAGASLRLRDERVKMGTRFELQVVAADGASGRAAIDAAYAEIDRVEALLSEWRETSEISELNRRAGRGPVSVGPDLFRVVERSIVFSELTAGAFDITFAACGALWSIRDARIPSDDEISSCLPRVGWRHLALEPAASTVALADPGARIGLGAIGKGYGVDRAAEVLAARGIRDYVVDGGGDIFVAGRNGDRPWRVGIADPRRRGELWARIEIEGPRAVVTSGDYERYFERGGVRYHHILDPRDGRPARASVAVTVLAPNATDADALATGLFVLGPEAGLALVARLPGVEALFFGPDLAVRRSPGFPRPLPVDASDP